MINLFFINKFCSTDEFFVFDLFAFLGRICIFDRISKSDKVGDFEFCQKFGSECVRVVALNIDDAKEIAKRAIIARNLRVINILMTRNTMRETIGFLQKGKNKNES